jgi:hypothetical protein
MITVNLVDRNISHANSYDDSLEKGRTPKRIKYVRNQSKFDGATIFTDECLNLVNNIESRFKIAWLMEPREYAPRAYEQMSRLIDAFDLVLTFDSKALNQYPDKCIRIPCDGIFLDSDSVFSKHEKHKLCSMIYSSKTFLTGHKLRHEIAEAINEKGFDVDMFGSGTGTHLKKKSDALNPYMFSVTIENSIDDFYVTEKAFDCFATRTIPIYWGTKKINTDFGFNPDGILTFDTLEELTTILADISPDLYGSKLNAVEENYQVVLRHYSVDDHIAEAISKLIEE